MLYCFVQFNNIFHDNNHTINILLINNIESYNVALYLVCKKIQVHSRRNYEVNSKFELDFTYE